MFFKKKKPNRLYIPTKSRWYRKPRRDRSHLNTRKIFSHNIRTHFSRFIKDAFLYIFAGSALILLVVFVLFSNRFSISEIEISRNDLHINSAAVSRLLNDYKGRSIFFFSKNEAKAMVEENFPEFSSVAIRKLLPNRIKVELETYALVANMKAYYILPKVEESASNFSDFETDFQEENETEPQEVSEVKEELTPVEQKALLNEIGQAIFGQEENLQLMTIRLENLSQPVEDRQFVIPTSDMKYLMDSVKYLHNLMELEVESVDYLPIAHEIHLITNNQITLWITTDKDYKKQIEKFSTIYKASELNKEDIAYVDLRIDEKFIYCPRGAACDK